MKKQLVLIILCFAAFQALPRQAYGLDCEGADKKWCALKARLAYMPNLSALLGGSEELGRRFANAAFQNSKEQEWLAFEKLLGGGNMDPDGRLIRAEIRKLPPEQWYYIIRLDEQRRILVEMGGGILGNFTQGIGNMVRTKENEMHTMKCMEQADTLISRMASAKVSGRPKGIFNKWEEHPITAKFRKLNEHTAPCFHFDGQWGPVDIVADSWADALVPARTWWGKYDASVLKALSGGRGLCGPNYVNWDNRRVQKLIAEEEAAEARAKKLTEERTKRFKERTKNIGNLW